MERWIWWRGRAWRIAGGDEGADGGEGGEGGGAAASTSSGDQGGSAGQPDQLAQLQGQLAALQAERDAAIARVGELERSRTAEGDRISALEQQLAQAQERGLGAYRRALLAEHAGQVVEELVQGGTEEALDASIEVAKGAYQRIADLVHQQTAAQAANGGGGQRSGQDLETLSPLEKIARGLQPNG